MGVTDGLANAARGAMAQLADGKAKLGKKMCAFIVKAVDEILGESDLYPKGSALVFLPGQEAIESCAADVQMALVCRVEGAA